jgi:hypothetical protein
VALCEHILKQRDIVSGQHAHRLRIRSGIWFAAWMLLGYAVRTADETAAGGYAISVS